ncbi:MAG: ATP-binding cassette domain-containing protein [Elusimicrobia bacterium]|nr:ATP-binding cassette domain-containing protein [Elusimicrobiota bacterium]
MDKVIEARGLVKNFKQPNGEIAQVLRGIDLEVSQGEIVAIMGPSGSGKSTLLHILGLMAKPDSGNLNLLGHDVRAFENGDRDLLRRQKIGFLFQFDSLLEELTVAENARLAVRLRRPESSAAETECEIGEWALKFSIENRLGAYPRNLSVGEACRANLLKILAGGPAIVFADEPTGNLDAKNAKKLIVEFLELMKNDRDHPKKPRAIVLVTHNKEVAEETDRVFLLEGGKLRDRS